MARIVTTLRLERRWWVAPYMMALTLFIKSIAWAIDPDDERIDAFIDRQVQFLGRHGFKVIAE